jgi:hypothetical protein
MVGAEGVSLIGAPGTARTVPTGTAGHRALMDPFQRPIFAREPIGCDLVASSRVDGASLPEPLTEVFATLRGTLERS